MKNLDYRLIKSKRKSISIEINKSTLEVVVKAPNFLSKKRIEEFISLKSEWILKVKEHHKKHLEDFKNEFLYFGKSYEIEISDKFSSKLTLIDKLYINPKVDDISSEILKFYYKMGSEKVKQKLIELSDLLEISFNRIIFKNIKTRWGSCSSLKNININIRLLKAPEKIIEYVLIHELCHIKEMNHSLAFWALVAKADPDFKKHRHWLKVNSSLLMRDPEFK